jgi:hypothetical protein
MSANVPYDQVVSLGRGCQPAYQIRRILGCNGANVFDWIVTTDRGLLSLIASRLDGFFSRERLEIGREHCVIDHVTETQFLHEFPQGSDFDAQYEANAGRLAALAERWRELLDSERNILFVRQHGWDGDARASATRLRDAIGMQAPRLKFALLYLTSVAESDWREQGILNRQLTQPDPYDWRGDDRAWQRLLADAMTSHDASYGVRPTRV